MKFKLFRTKIEISYLLLCLAAAAVILDVFQGFLFCVMAVVIHESGHLLMMKRLGYFPDVIRVSLFEICILDGSRHKRTERENILIIFFGPAANFICFLSAFLLYWLGVEQTMPFAAANLSVGLFNLLPVMSLDGGQLLYILLCKHLSQERAEKYVYRVAFVLLFPLAAAGFLILFHSHYNFSLLCVCAYLILSLLTQQERYY
ncbi:MAG: site-2 protease family protein [Ruminococcus sp.]